MEKSELIRASAGTGKTYQLTNRYLGLLKRGDRPEEILATTFTRKAAGEILDRVLFRLAEAATDRAKLDELRRALEDPHWTQLQCEALLTSLARRLHRLRVGTLDSFFAQMAGSFALEIGLVPGWRIASEHEDAAMRSSAIESMLDQQDAGELQTLVYALTRGETTRSLDREVRDKITALYGIFLDSSEAAWHQLPPARELSGAELDAAWERLKDAPIPANGHWQNAHAASLGMVDAGDWTGFLSKGIGAKIVEGAEKFQRLPIELEVKEAYQPLLEHARAVQLNQLRRQTEATYQLIRRFHDRYQLLKAQSRAYRFEDVTHCLARSAGRLLGGQESSHRTNKTADSGARWGADQSAYRLDASLRHLLLDEFQDTSLSQWQVLRPFAKRITSGGDPGTSFFCVGDAKQAIYGWRGGVAEIFDAVTDELEGIATRPLDESWRSSPAVIETVNRIFENVGRHPNLEKLHAPVVEWQEHFKHHSTARPKQNLKGYACLQAARAAREDETEEDAVITLRFAAEQVAEWRRRAPGYGVGVLVRRNEAVRRLIYELRELGIEASEEGGSSLDDSAAVRLVLALMQLADHPGDTVSRFHLASSPLARYLEPLAGGMGETAQGDPDGGAVAEEEPWQPGWFASRRGDGVAGRVARQVRRELMERGYGPFVYDCARQLAPACNEREIRRLDKLIGLAYSYDDEATSRPADFVTFVDLARVRDPIAADVRVMTVHQAKGLEFDIVVLADLESPLVGQRGDLVIGRASPTEPIQRVCRRVNESLQQLLPGEWQDVFAGADMQAVRESMCVLYVAVTRAVHALQMIVAPSPGNERNLRKNFSGLLRAALTEGQPLTPGEVAFEHGNPSWYVDPGRELPPTAGQLEQESERLEPLRVALAPPAPHRTRGLQRVSPSGLEGGRFVRLGEGAMAEGDRAAAMARGTLFHAWLEEIEWLGDSPPEKSRLQEIASGFPELAVADSDVEGWIDQFYRILEEPGVANCLQRGRYPADAEVIVENERPLAVREGDRLVVGSIDRLVTVYRDGRPVSAEILDYKTDAVSRGDREALEEKLRFYRPQLQAYRRAVASIMGLPEQAVATRLLFLGTAETVEVGGSD